MLKPVYIHRPDYFLRRFASAGAVDRRIVSLPWGVQIEVDLDDRLGRGIARRGVHELAVTETMWRLAAPQDLAFDVGANVGYFTALLSTRCQAVRAFEPHPVLRERLQQNAARWPAKIVVDPRAASSSTGSATLSVPLGFAQNSGVPSLEPMADGAHHVRVETVRLDDAISGDFVGVLKLDIEGHELAALEGAAGSLESGLIRDVFFEEYRRFPTPVSELLALHGFHIFGLAEGPRGVSLVAPGDASSEWDAPTFLATQQPDRALRVLRHRGWHCLRPRRPIGSSVRHL